MNLIIFMLVGLGITNLIVNASIFDIPRDFLSNKFSFFGVLLNCMLCAGFWVGALLGIFGLSPIHSGLLGVFCAGAVVSVISNFYDIVTDFLIAKSEIVYEENIEN